MYSQSIPFGITRTADPTSEPISIDQAKLWLRVDGNDRDAEIMTLIKAARHFTERRTNRAMISGAFRMTLDRFPWACPGGDPAWPRTIVNAIEIPRGPVTDVSAVSYVDTSGAAQTLVKNTDYIFDLSREPVRITPAYGKAWPSTQNRIAAVTVDFVAGYATPASVPENLILAMQMLVAHWFENHETVTVGIVNSKLEMAFDELVEDARLKLFR